MISDITVQASVRTHTGSAESRRLRRQGLIPAIVYGDKKDPFSVSVNTKEITKILRSESGHNTIFKLQAPDHEVATVMIKEWQIDPISGKLAHADLYRISLTEKQRVNVRIHLVGEAIGTKLGGGVLEHHLRQLEVECLPMEIPEHIDIDVSRLNVGDHIMVRDIKVPDSIHILDSGDQVVVAVFSPRGAEETPVTVAEPEVIKKGKEEKQ